MRDEITLTCNGNSEDTLRAYGLTSPTMDLRMDKDGGFVQSVFPSIEDEARLYRALRKRHKARKAKKIRRGRR